MIEAYSFIKLRPNNPIRNHDMIKPYYETEHGVIYQGNALEVLKRLPDESIHCCVTSPPYWGLRAYGTNPQVWDGDPDCEHVWDSEIKKRNRGSVGDKSTLEGGDMVANIESVQGQFCQKCGAWKGELGLEPDPQLFVEHLVEIFREVKRVLRKDGTLFLNLGDSYAGSWGNYGGHNRGQGKQRRIINGSQAHQKSYDGLEQWRPPTTNPRGLKPKDLVGIPWHTAFALQADGWYLRQDIIWHKPNPMPESVTDRCTKAHEYIFLLSKSAKYFYDHEAIKEPAQDWGTRDRKSGSAFVDGTPGRSKQSGGKNCNFAKIGRNKRSVWTVPTKPFKKAHFATFPPKLIESCILAGCPKDGTVLDPFGGAMTTAMVAHKHGRKFITIELSEKYIADIGVPRIEKETRQLKLF